MKTLDETLIGAFLVKPQTKQELKNWIYIYLDLDMPDSHLDGDSNASPMEAIWISYKTYLDNSGDVNPGYIWLSARDAMKTLSGSIFAVIAMVFFDATICWLASIEPQSKIALNNVQSFIQKVEPYLKANNKNVESNNSRNLEITDSSGNRSFVNVLVATMASVNGRHVNIVMTDETDLLRDSRVLDEVQAVASLIGGQFPLKIYFSTRKFAFGNMEKLIQNRDRQGLVLLRWDILDVTEVCGPERHKPTEPKEARYIHPEPPLKNLSQAEFDSLPSSEQFQYQKIDAFSGCKNCKLLSQCKMRLANRSKNDTGMLWKKIDHTINMFRSMSPDMANAQLLCRKPSLSGLVYPRFDQSANSMSIVDSLERLTGNRNKDATLKDVVNYLHRTGINFYVGGDWGYTHNTAFIVGAVLPSGEFWIVDSRAVSKLEFDEILNMALELKSIYMPKMWFMDTAEPMFIKTFRKRGMPCKDFKKDVMGGIEAIRSKITNAAGYRSLKVIRHERNEYVLDAFKQHHFKLDAQGNPTAEPDDGEFADILDALRYLGQNLFGPKGKFHVPSPQIASPQMPFGSQIQPQGQVYDNWMTQKIRELADNGAGVTKGSSGSGTVFWDMSNPLEDVEND